MTERAPGMRFVRPSPLHVALVATLALAFTGVDAAAQGPSAATAAPASGAGAPGASGASAASAPAASTPASSESPAAPASSAAATEKAGDRGKPDSGSSAAQAYAAALAAQKLGSTEALSRDRVQEALADAELEIASGRRDEAIGDLVYWVESPRFAPFLPMDEGRNAVFLLGDALGRAGASEPARAYLGRLLDRSPPDVWARRAVRSLVDFGLASDHPETFLDDLKKVPAGAPEEVTSDIAFLAGRAKHRAGKGSEALAEFAKVTPRSRFWAQATYLSGLVHVKEGRLRQGEQQFCKIADVKQTPREALAFGGSDFFEVRDLARLGLGRVAHEQYRFDDSRYYYYLVPGDSEKLPEALYESANSRYEAKDYRGARDLIDEFRTHGDASQYEDESWVFDAYVDLALCRFPEADLKLQEFIKRWEPVRDATRRTANDDRALSDLVEAVRTGSDPASLGTKTEMEPLRVVAASLRKDPDFGQTTKRLAELDHQMSGLRQSMGSLDDASSRISSNKEVRPRPELVLGGTPEERAEKLDAQIAELRKLVRKLESSGEHAAELQGIEAQLADLESRAREAARQERAAPAAATAAGSTGLVGLVSQDRQRATSLYGDAELLRLELSTEQLAAAKDALARLDKRLSRLLRRARLGRIETVLGKKRALEVEIEALSEGYLPQGAVDSLEAARYLRDDEEYWPFDGEDWADEYVGGEGLQ
ncbi:MAG TPA: hypothetical protein VHE30_14745 [Polyangiaceae bacterium]|nr:hypothetical protein [Polyangiaceae bacterium]